MDGSGGPPRSRRTQHHYTVPPPEGEFGAFLREERLKQGWTQAELAEKVDLRQPQISAYERGAIRFPDPDALGRIDEALGLARGTLMGKTGWQGAARVIKKLPPTGALVIPKPTPGLVELVDIAERLPEEDVASLAESGRFLLTQRQAVPLRNGGAPARRQRDASA